MSTTGGARYGEQPSDMAEARAEGRPPRKNLIRDSLDPAELRDGAEVPFLISDYGGPQPVLAARVADFVRWLEEETR